MQGAHRVVRGLIGGRAQGAAWQRQWRAVILALLLVMVALPVHAESDLERQRKEIEANLICQCGCAMVVNVCDCATAEQIRADITGKLKAGMSKQEILAAYVAQYGPEVLAAPPKKGFNLSAWITPFVAIAAGSAVLYLLLRRWVWRYRGREEYLADEEEISDEEAVRYQGKLEEELKKYF